MWFLTELQPTLIYIWKNINTYHTVQDTLYLECIYLINQLLSALLPSSCRSRTTHSSDIDDRRLLKPFRRPDSIALNRLTSVVELFFLNEQFPTKNFTTLKSTFNEDNAKGKSLQVNINFLIWCFKCPTDKCFRLRHQTAEIKFRQACVYFNSYSEIQIWIVISHRTTVYLRRSCNAYYEPLSVYAFETPFELLGVEFKSASMSARWVAGRDETASRFALVFPLQRGRVPLAKCFNTRVRHAHFHIRQATVSVSIMRYLFLCITTLPNLLTVIFSSK